MSLEQLRIVLRDVPPGKVQDGGHVKRLLVDAWDVFHNHGDGHGLTVLKLSGRIEDLSWDPPNLRFVIERHGRTVNGSSRAELHYWSCDVETGAGPLKGLVIDSLLPWRVLSRLGQLRTESPRLFLKALKIQPCPGRSTGNQWSLTLRLYLAAAPSRPWLAGGSASRMPLSQC